MKTHTVKRTTSTRKPRETEEIVKTYHCDHEDCNPKRVFTSQRYLSRHNNNKIRLASGFDNIQVANIAGPDVEPNIGTQAIMGPVELLPPATPADGRGALVHIADGKLYVDGQEAPLQEFINALYLALKVTR